MSYLLHANHRFSTTLYQAADDSQTTLYPNALPTNLPCVLLLDAKTDKEEKVKVTANGTGSITVVRGYGGTTPTDHGIGATVVDYNAPEYINQLADAYEQSFEADGTPKSTEIVTPTATQTLTNKTITDSTNNVMAKSLKSATTTVDVAAATAPSTGQVLMATDSTHATWQTPPAGVLSEANEVLITASNSTTSSTLADIPSATVSVTTTVTCNIYVVAWVQAYANHATAVEYLVKLLEGANQIGNIAQVSLLTGNRRIIATVSGVQTNKTAGTYTYKLQHRNSDNTTSCTEEQCQISVLAVPA